MPLELYVFQNEEGNEDSFTTRDAVEAREYARKNALLCLAYIYEFVDSEVVFDFLPTREEG